MYSIMVLICSTALSHADCQAKTAVDVVRGPTVDNPMMCALNAQTMIARTDLVQNDGTEYVKVVCTRSKDAEQWVAEIQARKAAVAVSRARRLGPSRADFSASPSAFRGAKTSLMTADLRGVDRYFGGKAVAPRGERLGAQALRSRTSRKTASIAATRADVAASSVSSRARL